MVKILTILSPYHGLLPPQSANLARPGIWTRQIHHRKARIIHTTDEVAVQPIAVVVFAYQGHQAFELEGDW